MLYSSALDYCNQSSTIEKGGNSTNTGEKFDKLDNHIITILSRINQIPRIDFLFYKIPSNIVLPSMPTLP